MPRPSKTAAQRASDVIDATNKLSALVAHAAIQIHGSPQAHAAWDAVEQHGAIIHRQSRILAGKSRGG